MEASDGSGILGVVAGALGTGLLGLLLFLASTVVFDVVHWTLHRLAASRMRLLRAVGSLHQAHHRFLDRELRHHDDQLARNLRLHVVPEFLTQIAVSALFLLFLPVGVVAVAASLQVLVFLLILRVRGKDINHVEVDVVTAYHPLYFCTPPYHRLHHIHPDSYYSSWIKTFDHLAGTGADLLDRPVALVGGGDAFGDALRQALEQRCGARVQVLDDAAPDEAALARAGIVILSGDPSRYAQHVRCIETLAGERRFPLELWACGRAEEQPATFDRDGRRLYRHRRIIYRHVPGAARSGPAARAAARRVLFWARRGFNWVPTRPALLCLGDYLRFRRLAPAPHRGPA